MTPSLPRTLFVGRGTGAVCWYRCALPAKALGADWIGVVGEPGALGVTAGPAGASIVERDFADYDVVVLQQPRGDAWVGLIEELQTAGVKVLFEVDDYLHAVQHAGDHAFRELFSDAQLAELEQAMQAADGLICSTDFIARRYRDFNPVAHVCRNGVDARRFALSRRSRPGVTIGWAGGTGHADAIRPWLRAVAEVMVRRPETRFLSVGEDFASQLAEVVGAERCASVPFAALETYPAVMAEMDVAIAPSGRSEFFQGKSDLRWLEASALGIPLVGDPWLYPELEDGVTGLHAGNARQAQDRLMTLVANPQLRAKIGSAAREHVLRERGIEVAARQWAEVLRATVASGVAV